MYKRQVQLYGVGRVNKQSIKPGTKLTRGQTIILTLSNPPTAPKMEPKPQTTAAEQLPKSKRTEPEDPELTPTLQDEKKYKQELKAKQKKAEKKAAQ